jgi:hypothetical protein
MLFVYLYLKNLSNTTTRHVILNKVKNLLGSGYETLRCAQGDTFEWPPNQGASGSLVVVLSVLAVILKLSIVVKSVTH